MTSKLSPFHPILRPILSEVFPHKLKFRFFRPANLQRTLLLTRGRALSRVPFGTRKFATRSGRGRMGSGFGQDVRAGSSKSLIEDEADLSDWVSGLNSNSFKKTRVFSDSDNGEDVVKSGGFRRREGAGKRRRESEVDKDSDLGSRRGGGGRGRSEAFSGRRKNVNDSNGNLFGGRGRDRDSSEFRRGVKFGGPLEERRERDNGFLSRGNDGRREKRQSERGMEMGYRNGRGRGGDRGGMDMGYRNGRGRGGDRGGMEVRYRNGRGRDGDLAVKIGGKGMERRGFVATDEEEEEEEEENDSGYMSFKELIDSDGADDDNEENEEEEEEEEEDEVRAESEQGRFSSQFPQSSPQQGDSYLSESR